MNTKENLIFLKGEDKTREIKWFRENEYTQKIDVMFQNGCKPYGYSKSAVRYYNNPKIVAPSTVRIKLNDKLLNNIHFIGVFENQYWHIIYENGWENTYHYSELQVNYSCLISESNRKIFNYLKLIANEISVKTEDDTKILSTQYDKMQHFLGDNTVASKYLHPGEIKKINNDELVIFPFGSNSSQTTAVNNALNNQLSVIEGPPGTGKTQTILSIIANLIIRNKTVEVVSNNNSATENIYEKLCKYGYGFIVAQLGKKKNREMFIEKQDGLCPAVSNWELDRETILEVQNKIKDLSQQLNIIFDNQKELAIKRQELSTIKTEKVYFNELYNNELNVKSKKYIKSSKLLKLWVKLEQADENGKLSFINKLFLIFCFGFRIKNRFDLSTKEFILIVKKNYYELKVNELEERIKTLKDALSKVSAKDILDEYIKLSKLYFNHYLYRKYASIENRKIYEMKDLYQNPEEFIKDYPIILSTTYSSRSSLPNYTYDYVIMDEATQVDVATGTLALSVAENAVIVGDRKQLPNVVTESDRQKTDHIFSLFDINEGYDFSKYSFLSSVCALFPDMPNTLLREHYRCHPKIIGFCNKKFYNDELVIMTEDIGETDVLKAYKTVKGNHARGHINQRQIDEICQHILPELKEDDLSNIGIIAPYKDQVKALWKILDNKNILIDTVHKFQGREKNDIIMSTVDDKITSFSDDENLLNVAVSRAVKKFRIVVNPDEDNEKTNIGDLVNYIEYNNFEIIESDISSIFDYLYKQYWNEKKKIIDSSRKVSIYDSENLMYGLIVNVLKDNNYVDLDVVVHLPLKEIFKNLDKLSPEEIEFVCNTSSHVDFMIYSKVSKKSILAIEVDGYSYHKEGTNQHQRDLLKNEIFDKYALPLLRFSTNGSGEQQKLLNALKELRHKKQE